jgi:hypothetical protein
VWKSDTITNPKNLERIRRKFAVPCPSRFFQNAEYHYDDILEKFNLQTLHIRCRHFNNLFLINVFSGTKYCPSVFETVGIRVLTRKIRNFTTFSCSFSHCPSARRVSVANVACKYTDTDNNSCWSVINLSWSIFLCFFWLFLVLFLCFLCPVLSYCCCCLYSCWLCN